MANQSYLLASLLALPAFGFAQIVHSTAYNSSASVATAHYHAEKEIIDPAEINNLVGSEVAICGLVHTATFTRTSSGSVISLNISGRFINETHTLHIRVKQPSFTCTTQGVANKNICFAGKVIDLFGKPALQMDSAALVKMIKAAQVQQPAETNDLVVGKELKLLDNAWLLQGPRWKEPVVTHLRSGSIIKVEYVKNGWSFVSVVYKAGAEMYADEIYSGYLFNQALGLNRKGEIEKKR